jgi:hypothetical protein
VVSCVAEKKQEGKKNDWFCSSYMYSLSIMSNTRLCHCCFSVMRKKNKNETQTLINIRETVTERVFYIFIVNHLINDFRYNNRNIGALDSIMPVFSSSKKKTDEYCCKIFTMDAELQFTVETTAKGHTLFSLVCQTIGLREHWYFGLKFLDKVTSEWTWLQMNRSVCYF